MIMANAYTNPFIHNMGLDEKNSLPHLLDRISPEMENEASLIEHFKYYNDVDFRNVLLNANSKISILSLNYDSLFARTVAFPVQVAYWTKEVIAPCGYSVPCQF